ncbi:MAG TPA: hypothetical protein VHY75_01145 [Steroidobacteraceae bacterium]|nr:hypothetical protein [Steroidobacteraceae bacterium]
MEQAPSSRDPRIDAADPFAGKSAASWPAIFAGAFVAVSATLILAALGSGFGFAALSPWPGHGASATAFTVTAAIWLIVTQWVSAGLGGYITGRLRTKWVGTHTHEVFFRDTAHGLVTWSVATVFVAALLAGSVSSMVGGGMRAIGNATTAGAQAIGPVGGSPGAALGTGEGPGVPGGPPGAGPGTVPGPMPPGPALDYEIGKLFRPAGGANPGGAGGNEGTSGNENPMDNGADPYAAAGYIALHAMGTGNVTEADRAYLAQRVAETTGISPAEAQKRVDDFISTALATETRIKAAADKARKAAAEASIYLALSMLVGAFIACVAAALGGRLRDEL